MSDEPTSRSPREPAAALRPARSADSPAVWDLLAPSTGELVGMSSLPGTLDQAAEVCAATASTVADLAAGSFAIDDGGYRRLLFVVEDPGDGSLIGLTGITFKRNYPNLAVEVATSADGQGLVMASTSAPWTRTELDSTFLGPRGRGRGLGTLVSRGRFLFLHLVASQIPPTVASHLRGRFDADGSAPFWRCFGAAIAPWPTSTEAEGALARDPDLLAGLAGHRRPMTAEVLDSMGPVNAASLPAFHLLQAEGLRPNGMYDPIDGGPTVVAELGRTESGRLRVHGRARVGVAGSVEALISTASIDRFRAVRAQVELGESTITIDGPTAAALATDPDALLTAAPLDPRPGAQLDPRSRARP